MIPRCVCAVLLLLSAACGQEKTESGTKLAGDDLLCDASERKVETVDGFYCAERCEVGACGGVNFRCADDWCLDNTVPTVPTDQAACSQDCGEPAACNQFSAGENGSGYCAFQWGNCEDAITYTVQCWEREGRELCECRRDGEVMQLFEVASVVCDNASREDFDDDCGWRLR